MIQHHNFIEFRSPGNLEQHNALVDVLLIKEDITSREVLGKVLLDSLGKSSIYPL